ncbi:LTA synthase family protein [Lactiplantibacillus songbeiensis]|uniref:LTA synthase family protein n=1 Tax=Lactiplantibacillus songbeiensis TaxID=2559920 RepID=A0ABW4C2P1_9LACO|nr:LTA synthase family protein [Lactiplantibacillus songbeiensis]
MEKPDNYSRDTMNDLVKRYQSTSKKINMKRKRTKQKVVFILSESFSDPMQVPGVKLNRDPIPYTRNLIKNGVGGNMISDGYGGGTANMEYQALTGLSLGNFSATLPTPYTQLVVRQTKTFSVNNAFSSSLAMHPYAGTLYSREQVFKKMRFNEFEYLSHRYPKRYTSKIGTNPYVSDRSAYKSLLYALKHNSNSQFVQLSTMQNHMPFTKKYYKNNQFTATGKFSSEERSAIETYSKGINYTDKANQYLLQKLKKMKENVTVVFYGDHLPSIYDHVDLEKDGVQMHKTPYFIWSNHQKLNQPKYQKMVGTYSFASEMLQATDSKVTPYYALVQKVSERLPIIASKVSTTSSNPNLPSGGMNLINQTNEQLMTTSELTKQQKKLLHDYELVQYDFTAGHHYALNSLTK